MLHHLSMKRCWQKPNPPNPAWPPSSNPSSPPVPQAVICFCGGSRRPHAPAEAQGASPHTLEKEKPSQGRENRLTAKSAYVGMLRIFRQLRKSCKGVIAEEDMRPSPQGLGNGLTAPRWRGPHPQTPLRLAAHEKRLRNRRGQGALNDSLLGASLMSLKSLVSLISSRLLAPTGRQITDGGVTPD